MAKFGQFRFSEAQFGTKYKSYKTRHRTYRTIPLGLSVRGSIKDEVTYRVRTGVNDFGEKRGSPIQDKYKYFVPRSINNTASEPYRRQWVAAVTKWKNDLTPAQKATYKKRIHSASHMAGYNLFMREAMKGQVPMFVDRGDPAAADFIKTDLTTDGAWHTLDLSGIITKGAAGVLLKIRLQAAPQGNRIRFRKKSNANELSTLSMPVLTPNIMHRPEGVCAVNSNREIEYNADNIAWTTLSILIRAWWT